ncbi:MAG: histidine--tRNA ligase [Candidatus Acetothermia bacterium]|jgi:histidyl-tRNA synthetase|nr:histidine--tRNA ligase [Candidatus Acetothermia bacterium]MDH7505437.1 histidine--tRNA ligase [Candidatus Acetothermia bacterium]
MVKLQLPRGMRDYPPEEKILREEIVSLLKEIFERYGFNPLETPVVERWEVLAAKYGGGEEILKETFGFRDQGGRELGLRFELTTSLARFVGMNPTLKRPFKAYQIGPVFRDGPIKRGRLRQFWQCDVDTIGAKSLLAEAELLELTLDFFEQLGLDVRIELNSRRLLQELAAQAEVPPGLADSAILALDKLDKIGPEGVREELITRGIPASNADRLLYFVQHLLTDILGANTAATNLEKLQALRTRMGKSQGLDELEELLGYIDDPRVIFTPSLARGLGYYTGTIFEVFLADGSFEGSLAAGGRYDNLIGQFLGTGEEIPAVGISFGLEPITEVIQAKRDTRKKSRVELFVIPIGKVKESWKILQQLRRAGIRADMDLIGRGVSANLEYANAYAIPYVLLIGPDELAQGKLKLRDMVGGKEELVTLSEAILRLKGRP